MKDLLLSVAAVIVALALLASKVLAIVVMEMMRDIAKDAAKEVARRERGKVAVWDSQDDFFNAMGRVA